MSAWYLFLIILPSIMVPFGVVQLVIPNTWTPIDYVSPTGDIYYNHNTTECNVKLDELVTRICYSSFTLTCASDCTGSLPIGIAFVTLGSMLLIMLAVWTIYTLRKREPVVLPTLPLPNKPTVIMQIIDVPTENTIDLGKSVDSDRHIIIINPSL